MSNKTAKKTAFSLIELSIVLVIIGLLIAGVTGGISLMKGAGIRSAMSEARAYGTAVNSFYSQYDLMPGDYKTAIGSSGVGDGDGLIEYATTTSFESMIAWQHLQNSAMIEITFTPDVTIPTTVITPNTTISSKIPGSKVKGAGWTFDRIINGDLSTTTDSFLILTGPIPNLAALATGTIPLVVSSTANAVSPNDALAIDSKIDDGYPMTGRVRIPAVLGIATPIATTCYENDTPAGKGTYYTAATGTTCAVGFQVSQ